MFHPLTDPQRHDNRALAIGTPFFTVPRCTEESPNTQRNDNRALAIWTPVIHKGHSFRQLSVHKALACPEGQICKVLHEAQLGYSFKPIEERSAQGILTS